MSDSVPFARLEWQMTDGLFQADIISQLLQGNLPQAAKVAIAAVSVGSNQELSCFRELWIAHLHPLTLKTVCGERVIVNTRTAPTLVV